jgi:uncharacterized protein (DUF1697 family)
MKTVEELVASVNRFLETTQAPLPQSVREKMHATLHEFYTTPSELLVNVLDGLEAIEESLEFTNHHEAKDAVAVLKHEARALLSFD